MAYEFKNLSTVEKLSEVPENANAFVEVDGAIKRVSGGALGGNTTGSGDWDAVIIDKSGELHSDNLSNIQASSLQLAKGSFADLYAMVTNGKFPKVCFACGVTLSYGGFQFTQLMPQKIRTAYWSAYSVIIFEFIVCSIYSPFTLGTFRITGRVDTNEIIDCTYDILISGDSQ